MSDHGRRAQEEYDKVQKAEEKEVEQGERAIAQEAASRAAIARSPLFAKVEAEVGLLLEELQNILYHEENQVKMHRAQGGIYALTKLLQSFTDAERTAPS